jgi:hypothetical protein
MDTSFKSPDDLEKAFKIPILVSIPLRYTDKELRARRLRKTLAAASICVVFIASASGIALATKGVDNIFAVLKSMLAKM